MFHDRLAYHLHSRQEEMSVFYYEKIAAATFALRHAADDAMTGTAVDRY
jgi:hypothetical protein